MLSRIAESLFWMNRYMERSDCLIRTIRTNYILSFDKSDVTEFSWKDVIPLFVYPLDDLPALKTENMNEILTLLAVDPKNQNSLKNMTTKARENARGMQDNISKELWEHINQFYHSVGKPDFLQKLTGPEALVVLDELEKNCMIYYGVVDSTIPRGDGWNFMNVGKFLERCYLTIDIAMSHYKKLEHVKMANHDILCWRNLLLSLGGYELYLKSFNEGSHKTNIVYDIVMNKDFTRSILYCLLRIKRYLSEIIAENKLEGSTTLYRKIGQIHSTLEYTDLESILKNGLTNVLLKIRKDLNEFSHLLTQTYFSYA